MEDIYNKMEEYNEDKEVIGAYDYEWHQKELARIRSERAIKESFEQGIE